MGKIILVILVDILFKNFLTIGRGNVRAGFTEYSS